MTTVHLFQAFPEVRETYRRRFRHVLVDEYQDTNHAQYALIHQLCADDPEDSTEAERVEPAELMVVGDADQSIYAFRGANIRNILDFEQDFPNATTILLEQNYRSTQTILNAANSVIGHNKGRKPKRLWSEAGDGERIVGYVADDEHDEARFVSEEIDQLTDERAPGPATSRSSTAPTPSHGCSRRCSSAPASPTRWSAGCASTSGARCATRSPTCGCWSTRPTRSRCAGSSTRPSAASATGRSPACRRWPTASGSRSGRRCAAPRRRPGWPPGRSTDIQGFVGHGRGAAVDGRRRRARRRRSSSRCSPAPATSRQLEASEDPQDETRVENLAELVAVAREFSDDPVAGPSADPADVDAGIVAPGLGDFLERVALVADTDQIPDEPRRGGPRASSR